MLKPMIVVPGVFALVVLGACSNADLIRQVAGTQPAGSEFSQALHGEYVALAKSEEAEGDLDDAKHFILKAKTAAAGKAVAADDLSARDVSGTNNEMALVSSQTQLAGALKGGAAKRNPQVAAKAQGMLDCWMQEAEENTQPADIARCRDGFKMAMAKLGPAKKKKPASGSPYTVYFKFNSDDLTEGSHSTVFDIMQTVRSNKPKSVHVIAHTDLSGPGTYNKALSEMRAAALQKLLSGAGAKKVTLSAMGDSDPVVKTKKPNQTNRRAVIIFN